MHDWIGFIPAIISAAVGLAGLLGLAKYLIEPWYSARYLRRKYATALWLACSELRIHLERILKRQGDVDARKSDALKKIPRYDWGKRADWFAKDGYYATITAYKIAAVSAWLRIYQRELLFLPYAASQAFLKKLYARADALKLSISTDTCFWFDYLDAVGDALVSAGAGPQALAPISFAEFCRRYATDQNFLFFFDQVHMYVHHVGNGRRQYLDSVKGLLESLKRLMEFLEGQNLLPGFEVNRPEISGDAMEESVAPRPMVDAQPG
jgi:hypothetical protein